MIGSSSVVTDASNAGSRCFSTNFAVSASGVSDVVDRTEH